MLGSTHGLKRSARETTQPQNSVPSQEHTPGSGGGQTKKRSKNEHTDSHVLRRIEFPTNATAVLALSGAQQDSQVRTPPVGAWNVDFAIAVSEGDDTQTSMAAPATWQASKASTPSFKNEPPHT